MGDQSILKFVENVLISYVVVFVKDIVVAPFASVDVVVQKVNKDLFVVDNPIDDTGTEFES